MTSFFYKIVSFLIVFSFLGVADVFAATPKKKKNSFVSGYLTNRYKFRTTGDFSDHDLEDILSLNFGNPNWDRVTGSLQGGDFSDLNGDEDTNVFSGINNAYSGDVVGRLYHAYVTINKLDPISYVRAGRQHLQSIEHHYFDGVSFETIPFVGFVVSAFGGIPVHLYEKKLGTDVGDWIVGGGIQWNPVNIVRVKFDYSHIKDDDVGLRLSQGDQEDNLLGASLWIDASKNFNVFGRLTSFSDELRDATLAATLLFPEKSLTVRLQA